MSLRTRLFILFAVSLGVGLATLVLFPELDLAFSDLFYAGKDQGGFMPHYADWLQRIHMATPYLVGASFVAMAACAAAAIKDGALAKQNAPSRAALWRCALALAIWIVGPGLIVNTVLKNEWGRARPHQTIFFGGEKKFSRAFVPSGQCETNCSFPSGDPSAAAALATFGLIDRRRRYHWYVGSVAPALIFGAARIMLGKHFLSDVLTGMALVYGLCALGDLYVRAKLSAKV
ncbi:MAG: phosphatase PAP2 family protein [Rickettsiales bacterium]